jgi:hypothetical protein
MCRLDGVEGIEATLGLEMRDERSWELDGTKAAPEKGTTAAAASRREHVVFMITRGYYCTVILCENNSIAWFALLLCLTRQTLTDA